MYIVNLYSTYSCTGYNNCKFAGNRLGIKLSEETKEKIGKSNLGFKHTEETKKLISKKLTGRKLSKEGKDNRLNNKKTLSLETKIRMSLAQKGKKRSEETKEKMREIQQIRKNRRFEGIKDFFSKLTEKDVLKIKILLSENILTQLEIGKIFNVSDTTISHIKNGKKWKHI